MVSQLKTALKVTLGHLCKVEIKHMPHILEGKNVARLRFWQYEKDETSELYVHRTKIHLPFAHCHHCRTAFYRCLLRTTTRRPLHGP